MLSGLYAQLGGPSSVAAVIISVALMLIVGFLFTRITKLLRLPNVTGYILAGIVIGPYCLDFVPKEVSSGMGFISDIALAFIAFSAGEYFRLSVLKKNGKKVAIITLFEALIASVLVFVLTYFILRLGLAFSMILAALASATAPASTLMTIRQTKARGHFVDTLLTVVALDDVVSLVAFSVAMSVAMASLGSAVTAGDILLPIAWNIVLIGVGVLLGFLLKFLMKRHSTDNRLIVAVAFLFVICGVGAALEVSPLLGCMTMGMVYINASGDEKLFKQLNYFSPPILLLFFVKSGLDFKLDALFDVHTMVGVVPLIVVGVLYFVVRLGGKYGGAFLGCLVTKEPKKVRNNLGLALAPQAGVAIGLAAMAARVFQSNPDPEIQAMGAVLQTIILSSSILYELVGPALAKLSLYLSGSYGPRAEAAEAAAGEAPPPETVPPVSTEGVSKEVETLEARLLEIEKELEKKRYARSPEEAAFMDAADETEGEMTSDYMRRKFKNRR